MTCVYFGKIIETGHNMPDEDLPSRVHGEPLFLDGDFLAIRATNGIMALGTRHPTSLAPLDAIRHREDLVALVIKADLNRKGDLEPMDVQHNDIGLYTQSSRHSLQGQAYAMQGKYLRLPLDTPRAEVPLARLIGDVRIGEGQLDVGTLVNLFEQYHSK